MQEPHFPEWILVQQKGLPLSLVSVPEAPPWVICPGAPQPVTRANECNPQPEQTQSPIVRDTDYCTGLGIYLLSHLFLFINRRQIVPTPVTGRLLPVLEDGVCLSRLSGEQIQPTYMVLPLAPTQAR